VTNLKKPVWLTLRIREGGSLDRMTQLLEACHLHTVCESAHCPNINECFARKTCTFMILGNVCTRNCTFCAIKHGDPSPVDSLEPQAVASAARQLGLQYVVVTSVTRDDLPDGGSSHFTATIRAIRDEIPKATIEVLIPDFMGDKNSLCKVIDATPNVINHNIETVPRIYSLVRPKALYTRSLLLLHRVHEFGNNILTKSGLMLGLGETEKEVLKVMEDLRTVHCDVLTLGQYLSPSLAHYPVVEYIHPDIFKKLEKIGYDMGFTEVYAGPLVRSSYHADNIFSRAVKV